MSSSGHLEHQHDDFGFDPEFTDRVQGIALWFYRKYWRVEVDGIRNVPARGRALLAANHAGIVPYDGAMIRAAIIAEHPKPRHLRPTHHGRMAHLRPGQRRGKSPRLRRPHRRPRLQRRSNPLAIGIPSLNL